MEEFTIRVRAEWDEDAKVYVATSEDVPGLATEAPSIRELEKKLKVMVPELLELNGYDAHGMFREVPMCVLAQHATKVRVPA